MNHPSSFAIAMLTVVLLTAGVVRSERTQQNQAFPDLIYDTSENFDGWEIFVSDPRILGINNNGPNSEPSPWDTASPNDDGFTIAPEVSPKQVGTPLPYGTTGPVTLAISESQFGLWGIGLEGEARIGIDAGKLFRVRVNWESSSTAYTSNAAVFVQFGNVFETGTASAGYQDTLPFSETHSMRKLPKVDSSASDFDIYLLPRDSGLANLSIFLVDTSGSSGNDVTINSVEVRSGTRAALAGGSIVRNYGGADFSTAPGESDLVQTGQLEFTVGGRIPGVSTWSTTGLNTSVPDDITETSSVVTAQFGPAPDTGLLYDEYADFGFFTTSTDGLNISTLETGLVLDPTKLYAMDAWISTPTPDVVMPHLLVRTYTDYTSFASAAFCIGPSGLSLLQTSPGLRAGPDAKMYTCFFAPNSPNADPRTSLSVGFLWLGNRPFEPLGRSTIRVHRIVLTEYDI